MEFGFFLKDQQIKYPERFIKDPVISVILPVMLGACEDLDRAIRSIVTQMFTDFELIVVDDGCTEETTRLMEDWLKKENRILYVRHDKKCGIPALRINEGLMLSRGKYIAYQFEDCIWHKSTLTILYEASLEQKYPSFVYGKCLSRTRIIGDEFIYQELLRTNIIATNAVIHPKEFVLEGGGFDCHVFLRCFSDWDLWLRWAKKYPFVHLGYFVSTRYSERSLYTESVELDPWIYLNIFRIYNCTERDHLLTPACILEYQINDGKIFESLHEKTKMIDKYISSWNQENHFIEEPKQNNTLKKLILVITPFLDACAVMGIMQYNGVSEKNLCYYVPEDQITQLSLNLADVVLFFRTNSSASSGIHGIARQLGKTVIYGLDDDLLEIYGLGIDPNIHEESNDKYQAIKEHLLSSDLVITYSPIVRDIVKELNPRAKLFKSCIPKRYVKDHYNEQSSDEPLRFIYAGNYKKEEFEKFVWPAFVAFSDQFKERIELHYWSWGSIPILSSPFYSEPFNSSYGEYFHRLTSNQFHVMLAPLLGESRMQRAKCPVKYLEATAAGCIGIYSDVYPYREIQNGITGIKTNNTIEGWFESFCSVLNMTKMDRRKIWENARQDVLDHSITESQVHLFDASIQEVIEKRHQFN